VAVAKSNNLYETEWADVADVVRTVMRDMLKNKKIRWVEQDRLIYCATVDGMPQGAGIGLSEDDMDPIQIWCELHGCGCRTSFDTFKFKNNKQVVMFMLKWA
jgi:hypothetical protein